MARHLTKGEFGMETPVVEYYYDNSMDLCPNVLGEFSSIDRPGQDGSDLANRLRSLKQIESSKIRTFFELTTRPSSGLRYKMLRGPKHNLFFDIRR